MGWYDDDWRPYVSMAQRRQNAAEYAAQLAETEGRKLEPVQVSGRKIAKTFWGDAWCRNLEFYSDFANRIPRGATYVRNGSVIDLQIAPGVVRALVSGSEVYEIEIKIEKLASAEWRRITQECSESIDSLFDLVQGKFADGTMRRLTDPKKGLLPRPKQIHMECSCPDYATMCKHVAATLYGVGARLDQAPELLFTLRDVDPTELIRKATAASNLEDALRRNSSESLAGQDLSELFGIDLDGAHSAESAAASVAPPTKTRKTTGGRTRASRAPRTTESSGNVAPKRKTEAPRVVTPERQAVRDIAAKTAKKAKASKRVTRATRIVLEPAPKVKPPAAKRPPKTK